MKKEWLDGRLSTTLAGFHITKENVAGADPVNLGFQIPIGEERSRGFEVDVAGEIMPGWKIIGSYAYIDAEVTEGAEGNESVGNQLQGIPENGASLWSTYTVQGSTLAGLGDFR